MVNNKFKKDKHGWIRIVEAFVAILLISGILILVVNKNVVEKDESSDVQDIELFVLRDIQLNNTLREEIVSTISPSIEWAEFESEGLEKTKEQIIEKTPSYLNCSAKVCNLDENCILNEDINKSIYTESVVIFSSLEDYNPRQVSLFCFAV